MKGYSLSKSKSQSGSLHLVVMIVLVVALLGSLGFIFWQNFINKSSQTSSDNSVAQTKEPEYKTYTSDKVGVSFQYPSDWVIVGGEVSAGDGGYDYISLDLDVNNADGDKVANLRTLGGGGSMCVGATTLPRYSVLESVKTNLKANNAPRYVDGKLVESKVIPTVSYVIRYNFDGTYDVNYGLTDLHTEVGEGELCGLYLDINTYTPFKFVGISFSYGDLIDRFTVDEAEQFLRFSSLDEAKEYMNSEEYSQIKKMILSLELSFEYN